MSIKFYFQQNPRRLQKSVDAASDQLAVVQLQSRVCQQNKVQGTHRVATFRVDGRKNQNEMAHLILSQRSFRRKLLRDIRE